MNRAYVVVESQTVIDFLRKVLPAEVQKDVELVDAGGRAYIASLVRSYLVRRRTPVAVFQDADSLNPAVIEERRDELEEFIRFATPPIPVKVVVSVPELETYFFAAPEVIEKVLGTKVPAELISLGRRDPKGVLALLAASGKQPWDTNRAIEVLEPEDIERIRATGPIQELMSFLRNPQEAEAVGSTRK